MRPGGRIWTILACGLCALAVASTIAIAAPARHAARHAARHQRPARRHPARTRSCTARTRSRRRSQHHPTRCRPVTTHRSSKHTSGSQGTGSTRGGSPTGGSGSGAGAPAGSPSGVEGAAGGSTPGGPAPPPSVPRVEVTAVEFHYTLSRTSVPAGRVIFDFVNEGQDEHNLNVQPAEGPVAGAFANTPSKGMSEQAIVLKAGTYTLFCSLPEHESKGMKATLVVE